MLPDIVHTVVIPTGQGAVQLPVLHLVYDTMDLIEILGCKAFPTIPVPDVLISVPLVGGGKRNDAGYRPAC